MLGSDLAAQLLRHGLHAVADAEHRHAELEHRLRRARRLLVGDGLGAAGEDDALGLPLADVVVRESQGRISQYTPISRTRRAISWVYCAPKSRIRTREEWMSVCGLDRTRRRTVIDTS